MTEEQKGIIFPVYRLRPGTPVDGRMLAVSKQLPPGW